MRICTEAHDLDIFRPPFLEKLDEDHQCRDRDTVVRAVGIAEGSSKDREHSCFYSSIRTLE